MNEKEREQLFNNNIGLAYGIIKKSFKFDYYQEDIKQEALFILWRASKKYNGENVDEFPRYAQSSIYRGLWKFIRKIEREQKNVLLFSDLSDDTIDSEADSIEAILASSENFNEENERFKSESLVDLVELLDIEDKKLFMLYASGFSQTSIAKRFGVSKQEISRRIKSIKAKLLDLESILETNILKEKERFNLQIEKQCYSRQEKHLLNLFRTKSSSEIKKELNLTKYGLHYRKKKLANKIKTGGKNGKHF